jgi:clan AA aspartic protease
MGILSVPLRAGDIDAREFREVSALVDTGASHTVLPSPLLAELGIEPHAEGRFQLASGEIVTRSIGRAWVQLDGQREMTIVVIGDDASPVLLGAVTLEEFGLGIDPIAKRLISVPRMLL